MERIAPKFIITVKDKEIGCLIQTVYDIGQKPGHLLTKKIFGDESGGEQLKPFLSKGVSELIVPRLTILDKISVSNINIIIIRRHKNVQRQCNVSSDAEKR